MSDRIRAGVVGLGRAGWGIHVNALAEHPGYEVVAVADPVPERRAEAAAGLGCVTYTDPEPLLADDAVELVVLATPSHIHVPLGLAALELGRHVVVEKPMATTTAELDKLVAVAEGAGRVLTCYLPRRLNADFAVVRDVVASGRLGELILVRRVQHTYVRRHDWQTLRKFDGGALSNTVPHLLDQVLGLVPDGPYEVLADLRQTIGAGDAEDHAMVTIRHRTGPLVEIEASSCVAAPQPEWLVLGTAGALSGSTESLTVRWCDPSTWKPLEADDGPAAGRRYSTGESIEWFTETLEVPPLERPIPLAFYDQLHMAIRDGAEPLITARSVRRHVEMIELARRSAGT